MWLSPTFIFIFWFITYTDISHSVGFLWFVQMWFKMHWSSKTYLSKLQNMKPTLKSTQNFLSRALQRTRHLWVSTNSSEEVWTSLKSRKTATQISCAPNTGTGLRYLLRPPSIVLQTQIIVIIFIWEDISLGWTTARHNSQPRQTWIYPWSWKTWIYTKMKANKYGRFLKMIIKFLSEVPWTFLCKCCTENHIKYVQGEVFQLIFYKILTDKKIVETS